MKRIKEFEILLDLTDRDRLYDYVGCQTISRPEDSKAWDLEQLKQYGQVKNYVKAKHEKTAVKVNLMDKAIEDTRVLEKKPKKSVAGSAEKHGSHATFDKKSTSGGPPRRLLPIYQPGEVIKGNLVLNTSDVLPAKKLYLRFDGQAVVSSRVYHQNGYYDEKKEKKFADFEILLWQRSEEKTGDDLAHHLSLLTDPSGVAHSKQIPIGVLNFPFAIPIPLNVPQSCPPVLPHSGDFAHLIYRLQATIEKDTFLGCDNISTYQGIWMETEFDIGKDVTAMQPITIKDTMQTGIVKLLKSGKLSVKVTLPHAAFVRGHHIPINVEVNNKTNGQIRKVKSRIRAFGKARQDDGKLAFSHIIDLKGVVVSNGPIAAGMCHTYRWTLPWDFSESSVDGNLLPVGDLKNSVLLDINYEIVVQIKRKLLQRNMEIHIPIKVGNVNSLAEDV